MRALVFALFFALQAHANCDSELRTPENSLAGHFHRLMNERALLQQLDCRLNARGLIIPDGGLCASTAGVNVLQAMFVYVFGAHRRHALQPDAQVEKIVGEIYHTFKSDARDGTTLTMLAAALRFSARHLGLRVSLELVTPSLARKVRIDDLNPGPDELIIATLRQGLRKGSAGYHAVVITSANSRSRFVTYSDPNFPNDNTRVTAQETNQSVRLNTPKSAIGGEEDGLVYEFLRLRIHGKLGPWLNPAQIKKTIGARVEFQFTEDAPAYLHELRARPTEVLDFEPPTLSNPEFAFGALVVSYWDGFNLPRIEKIPIEAIRMYHLK